MRISWNELDIRIPGEKTFLSMYNTYIFVRLLYEKSGSESRTIFIFWKSLARCPHFSHMLWIIRHNLSQTDIKDCMKLLLLFQMQAMQWSLSMCFHLWLHPWCLPFKYLMNSYINLQWPCESTDKAWKLPFSGFWNCWFFNVLCTLG